MDGSSVIISPGLERKDEGLSENEYFHTHTIIL